MYVCVHVGMYTHASAGRAGQRHEIPWSWSYRSLWATQWGCQELDSGPLQEQCVHLTAGPSLQRSYPHFVFFWGRVSCNPAGLKFIAILLSQPPKYWDSTCELPYPACFSNTLDLDPDLEKSPLISAQWWVIEGEISDGLLLNLLGHLSFVFQIKGNDSHVKQVPWRDWAEASSPLSSKLECV